MKGKLTLLALGCLVAGSCTEDPIKHFYKKDMEDISLDVFLADSTDIDLLNPTRETGIKWDGIRVTCRGTEYGVDASQAPAVRATLAAPIMKYDRDRKRYYMSIGEYSGSDVYENETAYIDWGDGKRDTLSFTNSPKFDMNGMLLSLIRRYYVNGKSNAGASFFLIH